MSTGNGWSTGEWHTLTSVLEQRLAADPDGPFLDVVGTTMTAAELDAATRRMAGGLASLGVGRGDRVASLLENGPAAVISVFAAARLGAISVPVNTAYKGRFLAHQVGDCGARQLVVQGDLAHRAAEIAGDLPDLEGVIVVGEPDEDVTARPRHDWDELGAGGAGACPDVACRPQDLATFIYTAGTTGASKGCMLSHNYVVNMARQIARAWERRPDDVVWTPLPLFHLNALAIAVVGTMLVGGRAAISRKFSLSGFWPEIRRTEATVASVLGSIAVLIANGDDRPESEGTTLRLVAGAPLPPSVSDAFRDRWGVATFSAGYGVTEASLLSSLPAGEVNPPNAAGRANGVEFDVRIFDDDDVEVPPGEVGEIVCRPRQPHVMFEGYWGRPEATMAVSRNWWFHTGDFGRIDAEGYLYFVDRKKDYLRRRGENISSFEMEKTFLGHEAIADVAVHSVCSELAEDDVKVTAVLVPGATLTEEELCRWSIERVPYFAVPRYIEFRPDLPRNPVGRVLKYELRDEGVTPTTWDAEQAG
ncbi:MAG: AMP-binding protein, partial [Acidimicrobiales bacterium]|nr:AMP-binding protein [Acidimicrobiales bacterium]